MSQSFEDSQQINAPQTSQYNWLGVLKFLQDQYKEQNFKETEQMLEKQQQQEKIAQIEADLKAQENINKDLIKRIKMLEFALRQERYTKLLQGQNISQDVIKSVMQDENNMNIVKNNSNIPQIPQRKPKQHRPLLLKILEEVGLDDIFDEENELNKVNQDLKIQDLEFQLKDQTVLLKENDLSHLGLNGGNNAGDNSFIEVSKSQSNSNQNQQQQQQQPQLEKNNSAIQQASNTNRSNKPY